MIWLLVSHRLLKFCWNGYAKMRELGHLQLWISDSGISTISTLNCILSAWRQPWVQYEARWTATTCKSETASFKVCIIGMLHSLEKNALKLLWSPVQVSHVRWYEHIWNILTVLTSYSQSFKESHWHEGLVPCKRASIVLHVHLKYKMYVQITRHTLVLVECLHVFTIYIYIYLQ